MQENNNVNIVELCLILLNLLFFCDKLTFI